MSEVIAVLERTDAFSQSRRPRLNLDEMSNDGSDKGFGHEEACALKDQGCQPDSVPHGILNAGLSQEPEEVEYEFTFLIQFLVRFANLSSQLLPRMA